VFSLSGKKVLVTGASSGIGRQIAIDVALMGGIVTLIGRDKERLEESLKLLSGEGHRFFPFDLTDSSGLNSFVAQCGAFDGVVLNAGVIDYTPVKFLNSEKIDLLFETNFKSAVLLSQLLIKGKRINKLGSLVFISSISSKLGVPGTALYASSKAALSAYAKVVASELAKQKIRSNSISPGIIITPMTSQALEVTSDESIKEAEKLYPLGYGEPGDVSGLVVYLLSDKSRWMTGTDLVLDGGLTLS
jgi:NAD(P)-dependent dehydrogenase (short-subunit alcohol dehydrogenase family)